MRCRLNAGSQAAFGLLLTISAAPLPAVEKSSPAIPFLDRHWQRPLLPQGTPPADRSALENSLRPQDCGSCHPRQLADWQTSLHARAMGPGVLGQLLMMPAADTSGHQSCLRCHAPLAEQADELAARLEGESGSGSRDDYSSDADPTLYRQGLICAACHLRQRVVYGPQARNNIKADDPLPHGGFVEEEAFGDSRFCAACHQFEADGYALNGKLLENTYREWRESPQARAGQSCQSCHMPERRHLWRGIHDPSMVLSGVTIELAPVSLWGERIKTALSLSNSGTGHRLPTYVTPRIVLSAEQLDDRGEPIDDTGVTLIIARAVSLDLTQEHFDTRLAPGETGSLIYDRPRAAEATSIRFTIRVEPDHFYRDFYRSMLQSGSEAMDEAHLRQALETAERSAYTLYLQEVPLSQAVSQSPRANQ